MKTNHTSIVFKRSVFGKVEELSVNKAMRTSKAVKDIPPFSLDDSKGRYMVPYLLKRLYYHQDCKNDLYSLYPMPNRREVGTNVVQNMKSGDRSKRIETLRIFCPSSTSK